MARRDGESEKNVDYKKEKKANLKNEDGITHVLWEGTNSKNKDKEEGKKNMRRGKQWVKRGSKMTE